LKDLAARKTPRDFRAKLAQLSWRAGLPEAGLLALHAIVRPSERKKKEASVEEKLEYAACLMRLGATPEALGILDSIAEPTPKTSLYRAFAYFGSWAYQEAIPLLQEFLEAPGEDPYQRLVAKVNLASALVFERQEVPATALLRELLHDTSLHKHTRLLANALEISATHAVFLGDLAGAGTFLDRARTLLKESNTVDRLFIDK
ncbi:MAG: hypothetical protein KDD39_13725, partial [Bdellovibrionales bacterium]|nr:hypothetical protein [Bdellovibrionales bacterium]